MSIDGVVDECNHILSNKKSSISNLLYTFGILTSNMNPDLNKKDDNTYIRESQFAIVYKYISDEKKSDRLTFKNESNVNAKATDFVNGLGKYLHNVCESLIKNSDKDDNYVTGLLDELEMIRSKSGHSLAQSLSTKITRYDNKALITAIHDALQRGVSLEKLGELLAQTYSFKGISSKAYAEPVPKYKEYLERQKAINNAGK